MGPPRDIKFHWTELATIVVNDSEIGFSIWRFGNITSQVAVITTSDSGDDSKKENGYNRFHTANV